MNGYQNPNYKTWDEWAKAAGVYDQLSAHQLALAEADPDYGWGTVSNKVGYGAATTPEEKAMYHAMQTELNRTKGFTGGTDGSLYDVNPTQVAQNAAREAYTGYGDFSYSRGPDYQAALAKVTNPDPFSYDYKSDPVYSSYAKQYTREGRRASEDTMGQYAAMTGGRPSTAAVTASQQAGNYYGSKLADKIPDLYNQAYQRYLNDFTQRLQGLNALQSDRNFEYGAYGDKYNRLGDAYNIAAGENATSRAEVQNQEQTAYKRELDKWDMGEAEKDRAWKEKTYADELAQQDYTNAINAAKLGMSIGDYSKLEELGYTPDWNAVLNAELASQGRTVPIGSGSGGSRAAAAAEDEAVNPYSSSIVKSAWDAYIKGDRSNAVVGALLQAGLLGENGELYENIQTEPEKETWSESEKWAYSVISNPNSTEDALAMAKTILGGKWDFNENTGNDTGSQSLAGRAFNAARSVIQGNTTGSQPQASGIPSDTAITNGHTDAWVDVGGTRYSYDELSEALGKTIGYEYNDKTGTIRFYKMK